ncbi:unnamed protein product, partial [marine sediment metagenome]
IKTIAYNFRKLKQRIKRMTPYKLYHQGYISHRQLIHYYGHNYLSKNLNCEYFKVNTNEGHNVIHILYRGEYIPYNYLVDNWQDIHNSWNINIESIDSLNKNDTGVAGYLVSQYITNQEKATYTRYSQSINWVYPGYAKDWYELRIGVKYRVPIPWSKQELYDHWDKHLYNKTYLQSYLFDPWSGG